MNRMYIRNVFGGKSLLDTSMDHVTYVLDNKEKSWIFRISLVEKQTAMDILAQKNDLNIFVVDESTQEKIWYYSQQGLVEYDQEQKLLVITTDHKQKYETE